MRIMLHSAIRDGRVAARLVGRNAEENLLAARGVVGDVEGNWIRDFIQSDPDSVGWPDFLKRTEFSRRDVLQMSKETRGPGPRASASGVKAVVENYVISEKAQGRSASTKRAWQAVKQALPNATRDQSDGALNEIEGGRKQRGRPKKRY